MSAQDDVLAAFGEPRRRPAVTVAGREAGTGVVERADTGGDEAGAGGQTPELAGGEAGARESASGLEDTIGAGAGVRSQPAALVGGEKPASEQALGRPVGGQVEAGGQALGGPVGAKAEVRSQVPAPAGGEKPASEQALGGPVDGQIPAGEQASGLGGPSSGQVAASDQALGPGAAAEFGPQPSVPFNPASSAQPYLDPAAFFAQLQAESAPKPNRRWPRLLLRYASALGIAGALGVGTAYAVTLPRRTDVPFLATPSDGRYTFPVMVRPAPPVGAPAPGADSNQSQTHYNDLRQYLVPAPVGAMPKEDGWESVADFESSLSGTDVADHLYDAGIRHVARRGWSTPDGQHTVVELLQFPDHQAAFAVQALVDTAALQKAGQEKSVVPQVTVPSFGDATFNVALRTFERVDGLPGQRERRVVFGIGDVVAVVTTTAPAAVPDVPTEQVVLLQAQMLR